jgi:hypothetical protein
MQAKHFKYEESESKINYEKGNKNKSGSKKAKPNK